MMNNLYVRGRTWRTPWLLSILGLLMLLPGIGRAQTYLSENFNTAWVGTAESGAPANWTQSPVSIARGVAYTAPGASGTQYWINLQRTGGAWSPSGLSGGTPSIRPDGSALTDGDNIAFMQDFNASTGGRIGATGARLISPSVDLSGATNPVLALDFFYSSQTGNTPVSRIEATTDNGSTWHTVGYLLSPQSSTSAWDRYAFNIPAAFRVANIRFAVLQYGTFGSNNVAIDNFTVAERSTFTPLLFRSAATGNWQALATWESSTDNGTSWASAGRLPSAFDDVTIRAGHNVTSNIGSGSASPFPKAAAKAFNLTIDGASAILTPASGAFVWITNNLTTTNSGSLFGSSTNTFNLYLGGNLTNNGAANLSTSTTSLLIMQGLTPATISGSGTFSASGAISGLIVNKPGGLTFSAGSMLVARNTFMLMGGTVTPGTNFTLGLAGTALTINADGTGSFSADPAYATFAGTTAVNYTFGPGTGATTLWGKPNAVNPAIGREIPLVSGVRTVRGTFTMNHFQNLTLPYPLTVGVNGVAVGGITFSRGILTTTATNILRLETNVSGTSGTAPTLNTSNVLSTSATAGSYVNGPIRIVIPNTASTTRTLPLGFGANTWDEANNRSGNARRPFIIGNGSTPGGGQDITVTPITTVAGFPAGVVPLSNRGFQVTLNSGEFSNTAFVTLDAVNQTYAGGGETFPAGITTSQLNVLQSTSATSGWTVRGTGSTALAFTEGTTRAQSSATAAPGPIAPLATNGGFFTLGFTAASIVPANVVATTPTTTAISPGQVDAQMLRINIPVVLGAGTFNLSSLGIVGAFDAGDIASAKVFAGTSSAPTGLALATINNPSTTMNFTGINTALATGDNYFWITYTVGASPNGLGATASLAAGGVTVTSSNGASIPASTPNAQRNGTERLFAPPVSISPSAPTICAGGSVTLTASSSNGSYTYTWFQGLTNVGSGPSVNVTPSTTTTYRVEAVDGSLNTTREVTVTVTPVSPLPTITPSATTACQGSTVNFALGNGNARIGTNTSTTQVFSPWRNVDARMRQQWLFTAAELNAAGVRPSMTSISFTVTNIGTPTIPTADNVSIKLANTSATSLASFVVPASFTTVFTRGAGGAALAKPTATGVYTYTFDAPFTWDGTSNVVIDYCYNNVSTSSFGGTHPTIESNTQSFTASAYFDQDSDPAICTAPSVEASSTTRPVITFGSAFPSGTTFVWTGTGLSATNVAEPVLTVPAAGANNYTFKYTLPGTCESSVANITITGNALPSAPVLASNPSHCGERVPGATFTYTGTSLRFYTVPTGGTFVEEVASPGNKLVTYTIAATSTLYVTTWNGTCESARTPFTVTVTAAPALTITPSGSTTVCPGTPVTLTASGTGYNQFTWSPATGLSSTTLPNPVATISSTTTYTVVAVNTSNGCSNTEQITITAIPVSPTPAPTSSVASACVGSTVTLSALGNPATRVGTNTGTTSTFSPWRNVDARMRQQWLFTAAELNAAGLRPRFTSLGFTVTNAGSPAFPNADNVSIKLANTSATSVATWATPSTSWTTVFSRGAGASALAKPTATGLYTYTFDTPFIWDGVSNVVVEYCYSNESTSTFGGTHPTIESNTQAFTASAYFDQDGAASVCTNASVEASNTIRPVVTFGTAFPVGSTFTWTGAGLSATNVENPVYTVQAAGANNLTARVTYPGLCASDPGNLTVTGLANAPAPVVTSNPTHCGTKVPGATFTYTGTLRIYDAPTGGTILESISSGNTMTSYTVGVTTTLYATSFDGTCESFTRVPFTVTVTNAPAVTITPSGSTTTCAGDSRTLTASGMGYDTYSWSPATGLSATNIANPVASPTVTTTYTVTATNSVDGCSNTQTITITVRPLPVLQVTKTSTNPNCVGNTIDLRASRPLVGTPSGTGTVTTPTTASVNSSVFPGWQWSNRIQFLFTPAELSSMGLSSGATISSFSVPIGTAGGPASYIQYIVKAANIPGATTALSDLLTPAFTTVYSNPTQARPTANSTATITFTTPFVWNGGSMLLEITTRSTTAPANTVTISTTTPEARVYSVSAGSTVDFEDGGVPSFSGTVASRPNFTFAGFNAIPGTVVWTSATGLTATSNTAQLVVQSGSNDYTASFTDGNGCVGSATLNIVGIEAPTPTVATNTSHCGVATPNVTINTVGADSMFVWTAATGGTRLQRTRITAATTAFSGFTMGSGSVWVNMKTATGCEGPRTEVVITTTPAPALTAQIQGAYDLCQQSTVAVTLEAIGTGYTAYTWTNLATNATVGTSATISVNPAGTTTYRVVATGGGCTNEATVTVNRVLQVTVTASTNLPQVITGGSVTLTATPVQVGTTSFIGASTTNSANSTTSGAMFAGWFGNGKQRYLFRASELLAAGYTAGQITGFALNIQAVGGPNVFQAFQVRMANVSISDMSSTSMANLGTNYPFVTVRPQSNYTVNPNSLNSVPFTTPFVWDGTSNVMLEYCFSNRNEGTGSPIQSLVNPGFVCTASSSDDDDLGDYCEVSPVGARVSSRPFLRFTQAPASISYAWSGPGGYNGTGRIVSFVPTASGNYSVTATYGTCTATSSVNVSVVDCPQITNLQVTGRSMNSVSLSWDASFGSTRYIVSVAPAGGAINRSHFATSNTFTITNMPHDQAYDIYVRSDCGMNRLSSQVTLSARTLQGNDEPTGPAVPFIIPSFSSVPLSQNSANASTSAVGSGGVIAPCTTSFQSYSNDLWYRVQAPANGVIAAYVTNVTTDRMLIDLFGGTAGSLGTQLGCINGTSGQNTLLYVSGLTAGQNYFLRVSTSGLIGGQFTLQVTPGVLWTGATNGTFGTAANWLNSTLPTSTQQVAIPASAANAPTVASTITVGGLNMQAGAAITLNANLTIGTSFFNGNVISSTSNSASLITTGTLTMNGSLSVDTLTVGSSSTMNVADGAVLTIGRSLKLNSNSVVNNNGTGRVILNSVNGRSANLAPVASGGTYNGNITQRAWVPQNADLRFGNWYFTGVGVRNQTLATMGTSWDTKGFTGAVDPTGNPTVFFGNEATATGWVAATNATQGLTNGRGVRVFPGIRARTRGYWEATGQPVVGDGTNQTNTGGTEAFSFGSLATTPGDPLVSGFHFLANPYPANINWTTANWSRTNIDPTIYVWDAISRSYRTYNHLTGTGTRGDLATGGGALASGQGFFVKVSTGTGSLSVTEAAKTASTYNAQRVAALPVNISFTAADANGANDLMQLANTQDGTIGFDNETDARKLMGGVLDAWMEAAGERTTVNYMNVAAVTRIPVNFRTRVAGAHSFTFSNVNNLLGTNVSLTLVDNFLGTTTALTSDFTYTFNVDAQILGTSADGRFEIVVAPASVTNIAGGVRTVMSLYPNPAAAHGTVQISLNNLDHSGKVAVNIVDALGRSVATQTLETQGVNNTWNIESGLAAGVYTVKVSAGANTYSRKLVIQ